MLSKVLVANRGESGIRASRAACELDFCTVSIYTPDDRASLHCQRADEAYYVELDEAIGKDYRRGRPGSTR